MKNIILALLILLLILNCTNKARNSLINYLNQKGLSDRLVVFITAMIPVIELRGSIPLGINFYKLPWHTTLLLSILGNILPVLPILFLLDKLTKLLSYIPIFRRFFSWLFSRTRKKTKIIERYEYLGLLIFVAIPWPGTGAWTGSLGAFLLGLKTIPAFLAICIGVILAGIIVTGLSVLKIVGLVILSIIIMGLIVRAIIDKISKKRRY